MADVIQQLRAEVNEAISGRMDMLNSINRISDLIPRNWEGSNAKESSGGCKHGQIKESRCLPGSSIDKFDNNVTAFDCPDEKFRFN